MVNADSLIITLYKGADEEVVE